MGDNQIKDRIFKLLNEENLSSSKFADIIDVQRSSISHIISGRNKPSLDFIQKVLLNFPQINPDWLVIGKGEMYIKAQQKELTFDTPFTKDDTQNEKLSPLKEETKTISSINIENVNENLPKVRNIEKLIIFYDDGTFEEMNPKKTGKKQVF
ncbi:MAG: helix-turn-helix transcriptional regulator [Bacteroidota bacterium]